MKLSDINKQRPFETPLGYFDSIEEKVMDKVKQDKEQNGSSKQFTLYRALSVAASFILLFGAIWFFANEFNQDNIVSNDNSIEIYELVAFEESELIDYIAANDDLALDYASELEPEQEEIVDYLGSEMEMSSILEELNE